MPDVRVLSGQRPTGRQAQQVVSGYVSLNQVAPSSFSDSLWVVVPSFSAGQSVEFPGGTWPRCHGDGLLPAVGADVTLVFDELRKPEIVHWDASPMSAVTDPASGLVQAFAVPAVGSFAIDHGLTRLPVAPTFYNTAGSVVSSGVAFSEPSQGVLQVVQSSPVAGTVVFI